MSRFLVEESGLGRDAERRVAELDERLAASGAAAYEALAREGRTVDGARPPRLALPPSFACMLAAAIALEEREGTGRDELYRAHYLEAMPRARVEQLATSDEPQRRLFHTPLERALTPRLHAAAARLRAPDGTAAPADRLLDGDAPPTIATLHATTHFGGAMPLLYAWPADLAALARALAGDGDGSDGDASRTLAVVDRWLGAPLVHELSHGRRAREALDPPYLDECVAAWVGVRALRELAFPSEGETNALHAAPWFAQVGQALARAVGVEPVLAAHLGAGRWDELLPRGLAATCARLGWRHHVAARSVHFLAGNTHPDPWMKLFFLAAAGVPTEALTLAELDALPFREVPAGAPAPLDAELLADALDAMCLATFQDRHAWRVVRHLPRAPIAIDLDACRVHRPSDGDDTLDPAPPAYFFPPALAARLRARGHRRLELRLDRLDALPAVARALLDGEGPHAGAGYRLVDGA